MKYEIKTTTYQNDAGRTDTRHEIRIILDEEIAIMVTDDAPGRVTVQTYRHAHPMDYAVMDWHDHAMITPYLEAIDIGEFGVIGQELNIHVAHDGEDPVCVMTRKRMDDADRDALAFPQATQASDEELNRTEPED